MNIKGGLKMQQLILENLDDYQILAGKAKDILFQYEIELHHLKPNDYYIIVLDKADKANILYLMGLTDSSCKISTS